MRVLCLAAVLLGACERAPSRLERLEQAQVKEAADEDLARGEAALASLKPRPLVMPAVPAIDAYGTLLLRMRATGASDEALQEAMAARLRVLKFAGVSPRIEDGRIGIRLGGVAAAEVETIVTALSLGGQVRGAEVARGIERVDLLKDSRWTWRALPVERAFPQLSEVGLAAELEIQFTPAGTTTLRELTANGQALALAVDDRQLMVAAILNPLTEGKLRGRFAESELPVMALVAALQSPLPGPLTVEERELQPYSDRGCSDETSCAARCHAGDTPACLGALERAGDEVPLDLAGAACVLGVGLGCTRMCELDPRREACREAAEMLLTPLFAAQAGVGGLLGRGCERGDLDACTLALSYLVMSADRTADFVTMDHVLMQIRDEALLVQASGMRRMIVGQAEEMCEDSDFAGDSAAQACLFAVRAHRDRLLAPSQPDDEKRWLRRAGELLARPVTE